MKIIKKIEIPNVNQAYNKVLFWFFSFPYKEISLNELSNKLKISKITANRVVSKLIEEDFLKREIIGKTWRLYCNIEHKYNFTKKICYNLEMLYNSNIIKEIHKKINSQSIILFGSYRKGDDISDSDIDIAIEVLDNKEYKIDDFLILKQFGYRKNVKVTLHMFSQNKINKNLFSNITNGIVLDGFLEVKK